MGQKKESYPAGWPSFSQKTLFTQGKIDAVKEDRQQAQLVLGLDLVFEGIGIVHICKCEDVFAVTVPVKKVPSVSSTCTLTPISGYLVSLVTTVPRIIWVPCAQP